MSWLNNRPALKAILKLRNRKPRRRRILKVIQTRALSAMRKG